MKKDLPWWQTAVFYQIYPRSFADANGDGVGDLPGIIARLDYLRGLGVGAIWLSPHYPSPRFDCGYDVADYAGVAPEYGTLDDFQRFVDASHERDIRVILDLVLNHTSDRHPWFQQSRASRTDPKRDWYVWRDGKDGGPPNNWISGFGGPAWTYDEVSGQYYYHFFFKEQPDLNWRNPEVKQAMWQAVRFWLERGVDGFRLDAISTIFEDPAQTDNEGTLTQADVMRAISAETGDREQAALVDKRAAMTRYQLDQPGLHDLMRELRSLVDQYPDRMLVGETDDLRYCGDGSDELHLVFNFPLMKTTRLTAAWVRANQSSRKSSSPPEVWPCNTLGNHDSSRLLTRFSDGHDAEWARLAAALLLTLRGTPFLYYGDEIGMTDVHLGDVSVFRDMLGVWYYHALIDELGLTPAQALSEAGRFTRDKCRTPMQWDGGPNAGFSPPGAHTWLPVGESHTGGASVAGQESDLGSLLNFYRRLLALRRGTPALLHGDDIDLGQVDPDDDCLAFLRSTPEQTCLVILNLGDRSHALNVAACVDAALGAAVPPGARPANLLFSSRERRVCSEELSRLTVEPYELYISAVER